MAQASDRTQISVELPKAEAAALDALAKEVSMPRRVVLARVIRGWIRPRQAIIERQVDFLTEQRLAVLQAWAKFRRSRPRTSADAATDRFLAQMKWRHGLELSRATLYNWQRRLEHSGVQGLIDRRGSDYGKHRNIKLFLLEVKRLYILLPGEPDLRRCYRSACLIAERRGWPVQPFKVVRRYINGQ